MGNGGYVRFIKLVRKFVFFVRIMSKKMLMTDIPKPDWMPVQVEKLADIEARICEYTSGKRAFVIYRASTVVFSDTSCPRDDGDYGATLENAVLQPPDFRVMPMQDGNYIVRFAGPVTGVVLTDFFKSNKDSILTGVTAGGLLPGEHLQTPNGQEVQTEHYYIGLYARAKLYADVASSIIVRRFCPSV